MEILKFTIARTFGLLLRPSETLDGMKGELCAQKGKETSGEEKRYYYGWCILLAIGCAVKCAKTALLPTDGAETEQYIETVARHFSLLICPFIAKVLIHLVMALNERLSATGNIRHFLTAFANIRFFLTYCFNSLFLFEMLADALEIGEMLYWPLNLLSAYFFWYFYWSLCHNEESIREPQPILFTFCTAAFVYGTRWAMMSLSERFFVMSLG